MALRGSFRQQEAGEELIQIEKQAASTVQGIASLGTAATDLRDRVQANVDGFFDPNDFGEVNSAIAQLKSDLIAAAAAL